MTPAPQDVKSLAARVAIESRSAVHAWRAGMIAFDRPDKAARIFQAMERLGQLGAAITIAGIRHGDRLGLIDELGALTFSELDARSNALACAIRERGLAEGECVGI